MPSTKETGHAKNVSNFSILCKQCHSFGGGYNPSRPELSLASIDALLAAAEQAIAPLAGAVVGKNQAVASRKTELAPLDALVSRSFLALKSSGCSPATLATASSLIRQFRGANKTEPAAPAKSENADGTETRTKVHRHTHDSQIKWLNLYIELLRSEPAYHPNESELSPDALETWKAKFVEHNNKVVDAEIVCTQARLERDRVLYAPKTGLVAIAVDIKIYVRSAFGANSLQYRSISGLAFTKLR